MLALVHLVQLVQPVHLVQLVQLVPLQCHTKHLRLIQEEHLGLHGSSSTLSPSPPLSWPDLHPTYCLKDLNDWRALVEQLY